MELWPSPTVAKPLPFSQREPTVKLCASLLMLALGALASGPARAADVATPFLIPPTENSFTPNAARAADSGALDRILAAYSPQAGNDSRFRSLLSIEQGSGLSLLCDAGYGVSSALNAVNQHCLLGQIEGDALSALAQPVGLRHTLSWGGEGAGFDLSFGLAWLEPNLAALDAGAAGSPAVAPGLGAASAGWMHGLSGEIATLEGTHWFSPRSWLRVTAQGARLRNELPINGLPGQWSRNALSVNAGYGPFAGSLTGHRMDSSQLRRAWFDVDLGLSWRTPWSGRFTVGARNLLNSARDAGRESASERGDDDGARTPFVRYQQDL